MLFVEIIFVGTSLLINLEFINTSYKTLKFQKNSIGDLNILSYASLKKMF